MVINGLRLGGKAYLAHFCPGPIWMAPLLVPVEIIGLIAKVFALAVRLFANMIAGHILLAVLLSFIMAAGAKSTRCREPLGCCAIPRKMQLFLVDFFAFDPATDARCMCRRSVPRPPRHGTRIGFRRTRRRDRATRSPSARTCRCSVRS